MVECRPAGMRACSLRLVWLGFRVGDKVIALVLGIGLVLGLAMVYRLPHFTFCHTSSPQKPASPQARILPIAAENSVRIKEKTFYFDLEMQLITSNMYIGTGSNDGLWVVKR